MTLPKICNAKNTSAFTLIELLIVIALMMFFTVSSVFLFSSISRSYALSERDTLVSLLTKVRTKALINYHQNDQSIFITPNTYSTFEGSVFDSTNPTNQIIPRNAHAQISGDVLITFAHSTGEVATSKTITISDSANTFTIAVSSLGVINW
jgi:type II secretory pathway pseudopilin PulG